MTRRTPAFARAFAGRWRIAEMDQWDELDLLGPPHITFAGHTDVVPAGDDKAKDAAATKGGDAAKASDPSRPGAPPPLPLTIDSEMKSK